MTWPLEANKSSKTLSIIFWLAFFRVDVILSEQYSPVLQCAKVGMTCGTAEVVKISKNDHELSNSGLFGGVHSLNVHVNINEGSRENSENGDYVDFYATRPIAIATVNIVNAPNSRLV